MPFEQMQAELLAGFHRNQGKTIPRSKMPIPGYEPGYRVLTGLSGSFYRKHYNIHSELPGLPKKVLYSR